MEKLKLVPHSEKTSGAEILATEDVKSSSSDNIYTVTLYPNSISCTCPAGGKKMLCKHMISLIQKNEDKIKSSNPEFYQELHKIIELKANKKTGSDEFKKLADKLIFVNGNIAAKAAENTKVAKNEKDKLRIEAQDIVKEIDKTDIKEQFSFFLLLMHAYNNSNIGFKFPGFPESLKPYVDMGLLEITNKDGEKTFTSILPIKVKFDTFIKFPEDFKPQIRRVYKLLVHKFPLIEKYDEETGLSSAEREIDPKYLKPEAKND